MPSIISRRLVIDASIAHAAGGKGATFPTSKHCRDFLKATLTICHRMVMTPEIEEEWNKHQSKFASTWRRSMRARKKIYWPPNIANSKLRTKLARIPVTPTAKAAMLKDIHLIEAALATDEIVISLDEEVRNFFNASAATLGELKTAVWLNPGNEEEGPIAWLEKGAKPEKHRCIGFPHQ